MRLLETIAIFIVCSHLCSAFMNVAEFRKGKLSKCYDDRRDSRISREFVNGQELPLPNSIETFISLVERIESKYPNLPNVEIIRRLLLSFRIDDLASDLSTNELRSTFSNDLNKFQRAFFGIGDSINYAFNQDDFTDDENCALHFMLSHTVNETKRERDEASAFDETIAKHPRELGVVSISAKWKQAFGLGRVLMGLMAGLSGNNELNAAEIAQKIKASNTNEIRDLKVNRIYSVTIGDLVTVTMPLKDVKILPNGVWNDATCPTEYTLNDNNQAYLSHSLLLGAIDGLILGRKVEEKLDLYRKLPLSLILRMYYGPSGLTEDPERASWCVRERIFGVMSEVGDEILKFNRLYKHVGGGMVSQNAAQKIGDIVNNIKLTLFSETDAEVAEVCGISETSPERRCATPSDIFVIMDYATSDINKIFQQEVIGNLSVSFDMRPSGSKMGVYTNTKPLQSNALDTIVNITGISGCPACFARHYTRSVSREDDVEVLRDLNQTLTDYDELQQEIQSSNAEAKLGSPAKVVLYFNYGNPTNDWKLRDAVWEIRRYFQEATILAIGNKKDVLEVFTQDDDRDVFTDSGNAANLAKKLKQRICKIPAEFPFKQCEHSSRGTEAENKQVAYIPFNKIQYWAVYPKYFLKSYGYKLKFRSEDGAQIKVCFSRSYQRVVEDRSNAYVECKDSSGDEIEFTGSDPCYRRNVHNCDPFYFSVEGKKVPNNYCENLRCSTAKDIEFEFQHEGLSCNTASFTTSSILTLMFSIFLFIFVLKGMH